MSKYLPRTEDRWIPILIRDFRPRTTIGRNAYAVTLTRLTRKATP